MHGGFLCLFPSWCKSITPRTVPKPAAIFYNMTVWKGVQIHWTLSFEEALKIWCTSEGPGTTLKSMAVQNKEIKGQRFGYVVGFQASEAQHPHTSTMIWKPDDRLFNTSVGCAGPLTECTNRCRFTAVPNHVTYMKLPGQRTPALGVVEARSPSSAMSTRASSRFARAAAKSNAPAEMTSQTVERDDTPLFTGPDPPSLSPPRTPAPQLIPLPPAELSQIGAPVRVTAMTQTTLTQ